MSTRPTANYPSWGNFPNADQTAISLTSIHERFPAVAEKSSILPRGLGRSYGDSCLNDGGTLLLTKNLDNLISFDERSGTLTCEAGVTLEEIINFAVPRGWFPAVTPGTKYVTVGGAIANDVHGKNHHRVGTFGRSVKRFELLRSNDERLICSSGLNSELYNATIGGLGLTGVILWAELQLRPIRNAFLDAEQVGFRSLDEFFALVAASDSRFEYTVAWIDSTAGVAPTTSSFPRGVFFRGNHREEDAPNVRHSKRSAAVPLFAPNWLLNSFTIAAFNNVYNARNGGAQRVRTVHYDPFFYPLDAIHGWNKLYGKRGFVQYQCVVPLNDAKERIQQILRDVRKAGPGSFLSVLKVFGDLASPGMLSFPRPGVTLALDFPVTGKNLFVALEKLDELVAEAGGAVYPAKDARMSSGHFRRFFPRVSEFSKYIDPKFSSSFWRRVAN